MFYFIIVIIILTLILYFILKDILKLLRVISIVTISSGYINILMSIILRKLINNKITFINISKVTDIIFAKNLTNALTLIFIGAIELILYIGIIIYQKYRLSQHKKISLN